MVREMVAQMLGGFGNALLIRLTSDPVLLAGFLCLWFTVIVAGNMQLRRIESETVRFVRRESAQALAANPRIEPKQLFQIVYPAWTAQLGRWGWFVPHRWELWPVPVRPETVQRRFQFTPAWLQMVLGEPGTGATKGKHGKPRNA